ncbi:MAG: T9SS type A sorting domain-containing protein [Elusimicrobia bacterium]|nr:T9SS type A sorting domain-containing protein [Elusimicrobiota bacterium]MBD3411699.1 T9SS type A sorting domain-containing protein [Elusimicrobiota bacterium]
MKRIIQAYCSLGLSIFLLINSGNLPVHAEEAHNMEYIGHLGIGQPKDVIVEGAYAYVAARSMITIIDVSNPADPFQVWYYDTQNTATSVSLEGRYLFAACDSQGVLMFDVSDPCNPIYMGTYDAPGRAFRISIHGSRGYVSDFRKGLRVIDILPGSPTFLQELGYNEQCTQTWDVAIQGDFAYVGTDLMKLFVVDINPESNTYLEILFVYDSVERGRRLTIKDNYLFVADLSTEGGLKVFSVNGDGSLTFIKKSATIHQPQDFFIHGEFAYVVRSSMIYVMYANPYHPQFLELIAQHNAPYASSIFINNNRWYVASYYNGFFVYDISDPHILRTIGHLNLPNGGRSIAIGNGYAYIGESIDGLKIVDVRSAQPRMVKELPFISSTDAIVFKDNYLYIDDYNFVILDVSNPVNPRQVWVDQSVSVTDICVEVGYAYVTGIKNNPLPRKRGLLIYDITSPSSSQLVGFYETPYDESLLGVGVFGDYAYLGRYHEGLEIVNIKDPSHPVHVDMVDLDYAYYPYVKNNLLYVACGTRGLAIYDISDPAAPVKQSVVPGARSVYDVEVIGAYAYITNGSGGIITADISDPVHPINVGYYDTPGNAQALAYYRNCVYVADEYAGLWVVRNSLLPYYRISGHVYNENGYGMDHIMISIADGDYEDKRYQLTDKDGYYEFTHLGDSDYRIQAYHTEIYLSPSGYSYLPLSDTMTNQDFYYAGRIEPPPIDVRATDITVDPGEVKVQGGPNGYVNPEYSQVAQIWFHAKGPGEATIKLYTLQGQLVNEFTHQTAGSGAETVVWDCCNADGSTVASGVYIAYIEAPGIEKTVKIAIVR